MDHTAGIAHHERALATYEALGDTVGAAQAHSRLGIDLVSVPATLNVTRSLEHLRAAEKVLEHSGDPRSLAYVKVGTAFACLWGGRTDEILDASAAALEVSTRVGEEQLWCMAAAARAWALFCFGHFAESDALVEEACTRAERARHGAGVYTAVWTAAASVGFLRGDHGAGRAWLDRGLDNPLLRGAVGQRRLLQELRGWNAIWAGDADTARQAVADLHPLLYGHLEPMIEIFCGDEDRGIRLLSALIEARGTSGNRWDEGYFLGMRAQALTRRDETEAAGRDLAAALAIYLSPINQVSWLPQLAVANAAMGLVTEARAAVERTESILDNGEDWRGVAGVVAHAGAVVRSAAGDHAGAEAAFTRALDVYRCYPQPWREAETLHEWGRARVSAGDTEGARERLEQAADLYTALQAGPGWLERVRTDLRRCSG